MGGLNVLGLIFVAASPLAADLQFTNSYHAEEPPEKAAPKWTVKGNAAEVTVADGWLAVTSDGSQNRQFYILEPSSGGWNMESGLATVEFRLKCTSDDPQDEIFRVQFGDGALTWRAVLFPNRLNGAKVVTEDWDTYRLVVKDGKMQISSEKLGVIASDVAGAASSETPFLLFGTFKGSPDATSRHWDLDFLRWTNDEALLLDGHETPSQ